jgi:hypothetical protein
MISTSQIWAVGLRYTVLRNLSSCILHVLVIIPIACTRSREQAATVSERLRRMKDKGLVERREEGWAATSSP